MQQLEKKSKAAMKRKGQAKTEVQTAMAREKTKLQ